MKSVDDVKEFVCALLGMFPDKTADRHTVCTAYYWANRYACEDAGTVVSAHPCVKLKYGPGIDRYSEILADMSADGCIEMDGYNVRLLRDGHYATFHEAVMCAIQKAYEKVRDKSFSQQKAVTHRQKALKEAARGCSIDVTDDVISDEKIEKAKRFLSSLPSS